VPVVTIRVESSALGPAQTDTYTGIVKPNKQVELAFRISGYVTSILSVSDQSGGSRLVQEGDAVPAGAVLASLNDVDYRAQANAAAAQSLGASANADQAKFRIVQAAAARQQASYGVTEARTALAATIAQKDQAMAAQNQAADAAANAQTQANLALEAYQRANTLFQTGSATKPQYDEAKAANDSAQSAMLASTQAEKQAQAKVAEAREQINAAKAKIQEAESAVRSATAAVAAGQAAEVAAVSQVDQAKAAQTAQSVPLSETSITAPFAGVVLARRLDIGSLAAPGVPAFVLADTSKYEVVFGLPEEKSRSLRVGQTVNVDVQQIVSGFITEIAPTSDPKTGVVDVHVTIPGGRSSIKAGMTAVLKLSNHNAASSHLSVPLSALMPSKDHTDGFAVYVVTTQNSQSFVNLHDIQVVQTTGENAIVDSSSLTRGATVVASAPGLLYEGEAVTVEGQSPEADNGLR
jgi:RND family efflux transporter MFP subunit